MVLDKKVIALAARTYRSIAAPYGLCVFSIDLAVFDDGLAILSMVFSVFVDVFSQRSMNKTDHSMD
jgi:hypothetical protein